jgi:hypothetical protein
MNLLCDVSDAMREGGNFIDAFDVRHQHAGARNMRKL